MMRKIFHQLHLWLSIPFGIVITLVCFSGAMLVFEEDVKHLVHPERYYAAHPAEGTPLPIPTLLEEVASTLPDSVQVTGLTIPADTRRNYGVYLSFPHKAMVYIDPYSGKVAGAEPTSGFFRVMENLHRWLLDDEFYGGKMVVGISTLALLIILLTGVVIWFPRNARRLRSSFRIVWGKGWRRFWYDCHIAGSLYSFLLLLVLALTGLTWSFDWYSRLYYRTFGVVSQQSGGHGGHETEEQPTLPASYPHWQSVYEQVANANPTFKKITLYDGMAQLYPGRWGNRLAADTYLFDTAEGDITRVIPYEDTDQETKVWGWTYSIHVGNWGGWVTQILSFIAALLGASLPLTGYYLWIKRLRSKRH